MMKDEDSAISNIKMEVEVQNLIPKGQGGIRGIKDVWPKLELTYKW